MKQVIDGDKMKCLEKFNPEDTEIILAKYRDFGKWEEVEVDIDGDIILYKQTTHG